MQTRLPSQQGDADVHVLRRLQLRQLRDRREVLHRMHSALHADRRRGRGILHEALQKSGAGRLQLGLLHSHGRVSVLAVRVE